MTGDAATARGRPLYKGTTDARLVSTTVGNAGLWYDKFCNRWNGNWDGLGDTGKRDWIAELLDGKLAKRVGDAELVREAVRRQAELVRRLGGRTFPLATAWRFVSGLGRSHPIENGFAWHHVLGVPYLPGSSVKGLARAWARWANDSGNQDNAPSIEVTRLFGTAQQGSGAVGSVIFLDALPVTPPALDADVMTPHYGPWYQEGEAPGDWHSPTPIPFLTVAPGQTFQFALLPRTPADTADCEQAATLLREALATLGAGAKTATGYGVFLCPPTDASEHGMAPAKPPTKQAMDLPFGELRSVLLEKKTKKGGWMARLVGTDWEGPIQGSPHPDCKPGDEVVLVRANRTDFKWPTDEDLKPHSTHARKPRGRATGKDRKGKRG